MNNTSEPITSAKFWRNSSQTRPSRFVMLCKYILLIPATPIAVFIVLLPPRSSRSYNENRVNITDGILAEPTLFLSITLLIGCLLWLWTVLALSRATFELNEKGIKYCAYGFFTEQISFASVEVIKPYRIFPFGTLIDMKSPIGSNIRFFVFVARVRKDQLREFLKNTDIEVK
jgi:hypothetical protein